MLERELKVISRRELTSVDTNSEELRVVYLAQVVVVHLVENAFNLECALLKNLPEVLQGDRARIALVEVSKRLAQFVVVYLCLVA
jgi:hypothetical protein